MLHVLFLSHPHILNYLSHVRSDLWKRFLQGHIRTSSVTAVPLEYRKEVGEMRRKLLSKPTWCWSCWNTAGWWKKEREEIRRNKQRRRQREYKRKKLNWWNDYINESLTLWKFQQDKCGKEQEWEKRRQERKKEKQIRWSLSHSDGWWILWAVT